MKIKMLSSIFLVVSLTSVFSQAENSQTCWEAAQEVMINTNIDIGCAVASDKESFAKICSLDGVQPTKEFKVYLVYRNEFQSVEEQVQTWMANNPGAAQIPMPLAIKLETAETDLMVGGKRSLINNTLEKILRASVSCR